LIYVTVGVSQGFTRLVRIADRIAKNHKEKFIIQTGDTKYTPRHAESVDVLPVKEHENNFTEASAVVGHAGTGTLLTAIENEARLVLFPRLPERDEVYDAHQLHHIDGWSKRLNVPVAKTGDELRPKLTNPEKIPMLHTDIGGGLIENIGDIVRDEANTRINLLPWL